LRGVDRSGDVREISEATRYGPVRSSDTLYSIADRLRPAPLTINQMMLALLAANPDAFNAPNINALQRGASLRVPSTAELRFPEVEAADRAVREQLADWAASSTRSEIAEQVTRLSRQLEAVHAVNARLEADNQRLEQALGGLRADLDRVESLLSSPREAPAEASMLSEVVAAMQRPMAQGPVAVIAFLVLLLMTALWWGVRSRRLRPVHAERVVDNATEALGQARARIAEGRLEAAQAVLDDALGEQPDSIQLRVGLLDVLAMRADRAGYETEAHVLHAQIGNEADARWQRVVHQGRELSPDHPLFSPRD